MTVDVIPGCTVGLSCMPSYAAPIFLKEKLYSLQLLELGSYHFHRLSGWVVNIDIGS